MYQAWVTSGNKTKSLPSWCLHSSDMFAKLSMFKQKWSTSPTLAPLPLPSIGLPMVMVLPFTQWLLFHLTLTGSKSCQVHNLSLLSTLPAAQRTPSPLLLDPASTIRLTFYYTLCSSYIQLNPPFNHFHDPCPTACFSSCLSPLSFSWPDKSLSSSKD